MAMVVKIPNAIATGLRLRLTFIRNGSFWSAPPRLLHILHPKSLSAAGANVISSVDYLVSSLSISPESEAALKMTKRKPYAIKSTAKADSVMALFSAFGFSRIHLANLFSSSPRLLGHDPDKMLRPKLDFLVRSGISGGTLIHLITTDPRILQRSLKNQIIPCVNLLRTFFDDGDHQALSSFLSNKRAASIFRNFSEATTPANVETLRRHGVPDSSILRLALLGGGPTILARDTEQFSEIVREIKNMGLDPLCNMFPYGLRTFAGMSKEKWVSKVELLKKCFGWRDDQQVVALFIKHSNIMSLSEEKLKQGLEIFMDRLGWTPDYVAKYPALLTCSFNKRILPRISVLEMLQSKGLVKNAITGNAFLMTEDSFLRMYVNKYQQYLQVELLDIYTSTMDMES